MPFHQFSELLLEPADDDEVESFLSLRVDVLMVTKYQIYRVTLRIHPSAGDIVFFLIVGLRVEGLLLEIGVLFVSPLEVVLKCRIPAEELT